MKPSILNLGVLLAIAAVMVALSALRLSSCSWCLKPVGWLPRLRRFGGGWWLQCSACSRRAREFRRYRSETEWQRLQRRRSEKYGAR